MNINDLGYPHPVLSNETNDYTNSSFSMTLLHTPMDDADCIPLQLQCRIDCPGLVEMIGQGKAKAIVRVVCPRTSLRKAYDLNPDTPTKITLAKTGIADNVFLQGMVVTTTAIPQFRLAEFNTDYFGDACFPLRKGDILAIEPGIHITLNSIMERNLTGVVMVVPDNNAEKIRVHYAQLDEEQDELADNITIIMPKKEYEYYGWLMSKRHLRNGAARLLQAAVVLPAVTEAIGKLRYEEETDPVPGNVEPHYKGTVWANAIYAAMRKHNIELEDTAQTNYDIANTLLGNLVSDAIQSMHQQVMEEIDTEEDEPL